MSKRHESKLPIMIVEFQNIRVFLPQLNSFLFLCSEKYTIFWEFSLQKALKFFYFLQFVSLIGDDELLVRAQCIFKDTLIALLEILVFEKIGITFIQFLRRPQIVCFPVEWFFLIDLIRVKQFIIKRQIVMCCLHRTIFQCFFSFL